MAKDSYRRKELESASRTEASNREALVAFYKAMGQLSGNQIPKELAAEENSSTAIDEAQKLLDRQISESVEAAPALGKREMGTLAGKLALAYFLIDRTKKLREIALKTNRLTLFSLYSSLRNRVCEVLAGAYYTKTSAEILDDYISIEPLLAACSELCGLAVPAIEEIMDEYKARIADEIRKSGE